MRILHYFLGFPPFRNGGSVFYPIDLALEQKKLGHDVIMLWPGHFNFINNLTNKYKIKRHSNVLGIENFEILNPLPVSGISGIKDPSIYLKKVSTNYFEDFLRYIKPDVIHFHTLMGFYPEFMETIKKLKIKTVFTTHDYFGLCFKTRFFYNSQICPNTNKFLIERCVQCNINAPSTLLLKFRSMRIFEYQASVGFKSILKKIIGNANKNEIYLSNGKENAHLKKVIEYFELLNLYKEFFKNIDVFHFNSSVSRMLFENQLGKLNGEIIHITHKYIRNKNKHDNEFNISRYIYLIYAGGETEEKGFNILYNSLSKLWIQGYENFKLILYGEYSKKNFESFVINKGRYKRTDLRNIFKDVHIAIIPSIWYETFSLFALEALSFGIPVLITDTVGIKDLVLDNQLGIVSKIQDLSFWLEQLISNPDMLKIFRERISSFELPEVEEHSKKIIQLYSESWYQ